MKQEKIAEWKAKGIDWLANQLWLQRNRHLEMNQNLNTVERELRQVKSENEITQTVKQQNRNLAKILEENGIRPAQLRITYQEKDCKGCKFGSDLGSGEYDCYSDFQDYEYCPKKKIVETVSFYTYKIDNDVICGILNTFDGRGEYDVLKVVDCKTGEVIWEREAE